MARPSPKLKMDWSQIQILAEKGVPMQEIAKASGALVGSIRARSYKENWLTPVRRANAMAGAGNELVLASGIESVIGQNDALSEPLSDIAEVKDMDYGKFVAAGAAAKVRRALAAMPVPRTWKDLNTADLMVRRALGLDKQTMKTSTLFNPESGIMGIMQEITSNPVDNAE